MKKIIYLLLFVSYVFSFTEQYNSNYVLTVNGTKRYSFGYETSKINNINYYDNFGLSIMYPPGIVTTSSIGGFSSNEKSYLDLSNSLGIYYNTNRGKAAAFVSPGLTIGVKLFNISNTSSIYLCPGISLNLDTMDLLDLFVKLDNNERKMSNFIPYINFKIDLKLIQKTK